ncbi:uncharacterized protein ALTATR162_LOCUS2998 [Alternaria atra]|uniref:Uncharacterized protein n=1 Tax=Alternaria atra TaxID=119953 RepID=A0A8J2N3I9_9PLEO|nr:uncharacterized protein ALTATR162_LOCUS2998 [Alternaria atra]CAG5153007.1 unnamed protein product [Alternaria atra]
MSRTLANTSPPAQYGMSPTLSANSHMPTLPLSTTQTQSASLGQERQQINASNGSTHSQQSRMPPPNAARYQQSPTKQGHPHAQTKRQSSPIKQSCPQIAGRKRQATDATEGTRPADKRQNMTPHPSAAHATPIHQNASPSHQAGTYHRVNGMRNGASNVVASTTKDANRERHEQQAKLEAEHRLREHQARAAEEARIAEQYRIAHAAALQREKDDKRREELCKDPSANFRHILEVYKLMPLKKGELPNRYLTGLIANRQMPMDLDCDLALAITFAKDHWEHYGQWPKDITRFVGYERERRAKAKEQA